MVFFTVAIHVLLFGLCAGAAISVLFFVPLTLYLIPYWLWVGTQNTRGRHKDKRDVSLSKSARYATKLYKAKLSGKEPIF